MQGLLDTFLQPENTATLVLFAAGLYLLVRHYFAVRAAEASLGWEEAEGRVLASGVEHQDDYDSDRHRRTRVYAPFVRFEYQAVDGRHLSERLAFGPRIWISSEDSAASTARRYAAGTEVTVYVNPENPADAVLERRTHGGDWPMAIGIACLAGAVAFQIFDVDGELRALEAWLQSLTSFKR
jgi:hypothetical protein